MRNVGNEFLAESFEFFQLVNFLLLQFSKRENLFIDFFQRVKCSGFLFTQFVQFFLLQLFHQPVNLLDLPENQKIEHNEDKQEGSQKGDRKHHRQQCG